MNVADIFTGCAPHYASKPLFFHPAGSDGYHEFADGVSRLTSALLLMGAKRGTRVVLLAGNRSQWLACFFAIMATGAAAVPINPALAGPEVRTIIDHCEPVVAIVQEEFVPLLQGAGGRMGRCILGSSGIAQWRHIAPSNMEQRAEMQADDPALIYYTSGTTGRPKGVVLSHGAVLFATRMFSRHLQIVPSDRSLVTGSMAFILHLILNALSSMTGGAGMVLLDRFHPELAVNAIERHKVTLLMAVPTAYVMMLNWLEENRNRDISSIRCAITAGASFPAALYQRARRRLGFPVFDLWGMTECAPMTTYDPSIDREGRLDSCGRPLPESHIRVVDDALQDLAVGEVGEVLLRSPAMMSGYFRNPQATAETIVGGWIRSGDLGRVDADGFLYIVGRKKDLIIRGAANIYPVDVEEVLYAHPAVGECAVVGVPDETFGETVKAFVILKNGARASADELIEHCRRNIAEYKVPSRIEFAESLPKGATGKILRRELRAAS